MCLFSDSVQNSTNIVIINPILHELVPVQRDINPSMVMEYYLWLLVSTESVARKQEVPGSRPAQVMMTSFSSFLLPFILLFPLKEVPAISLGDIT